MFTPLLVTILLPSLASCAGGALHSNALFNLIDVWAGISSFTDAFNKIPEAVIHTHYWIENNPTAVLSLESNYPQSTGSKDFYDYFWNSWRPPDDQPTVVVAGPSCCHLSVVGKGTDNEILARLKVLIQPN